MARTPVRRREKGSFMSPDDAVGVRLKPDEDKTFDAAQTSARDIADVIMRRHAMLKRARNLPEPGSVCETAPSPVAITITPPMTALDPRPRAASPTDETAPSPTAVTLPQLQFPDDPAPPIRPAPPSVVLERTTPQLPLPEQPAPAQPPA